MAWLLVVALLLCSNAYLTSPFRVTLPDRWNHYVDPYFNLSGVHRISPDRIHQRQPAWNFNDPRKRDQHLWDKGTERHANLQGNSIDLPPPESGFHPATRKDTSLRWDSQRPQADMATIGEYNPQNPPSEALAFSRHSAGYPHANHDLPTRASLPRMTGFQPHGMVWNENGQYWGYPPELSKQPLPSPGGDSLYWPYDSQPGLINGPDCIPPFCIPINCANEKCKPSVTVSCTGSDCEFPCDRGPSGSRPCPQNDPPCRSGLFGDKCHLLHPAVCRQSHALDCRYGCGGQLPGGTVLLCLCDPWTRNETVDGRTSCLSTENQLFVCPLDCTGRGQCEPSTKTCRCEPGFHGRACEQATDLLTTTPTTTATTTQTTTTKSPGCPAGLTGKDCRLDVDECLSGGNKCEQRCVNTYGSFRCECYQGFQVDVHDPSRCLPVAESSCHEKCVPGQGECVSGNVCLCRPGFEGESCERDLDECQTGRHACQQVCVNTHGSYTCQCHPGYRVDERNPYACLPLGCNPPCVAAQGRCNPQGQCECSPGFTGVDCSQDVDECATGQHTCQQRCVNVHGTYRCDCNLGYVPDPIRGARCLINGTCDPRCSTDQDECRGRQCLNGGTCRLIGSRHECSCPYGHQGSRCETDVDECAGPSGVGFLRCDHTCVNLPGSYKCTCRHGYHLQPDNHVCVPDRVEACSGGCLNGGVCITAMGRCECPRGFRGPRCEVREEGGCKAVMQCEYDCLTRPDGGYQCICPDGFTLHADGKTCSRRDSCPNLCLNGGYCFQGRCICMTGFEGEACESDRNECLEPGSAHVCSHRCQNTFGSFECLCPEGQRRLDDRRTCVIDKPASSCDPPCRNGGVCTPSNRCECLRGFEGIDCGEDVDECSRFAPCDTTRGECLNRPGWYECTCKPGYRLTVDGHQCIEVWRAQENPGLVFRGRGQKGIVVANRVNSPTSNPGVVTFSNRREQRKRRRRFGAMRLNRRHANKLLDRSLMLARRNRSPGSVKPFRLGDRGLKLGSVVVLNSDKLASR